MDLLKGQISYKDRSHIGKYDIAEVIDIRWESVNFCIVTIDLTEGE